MIPKWLRYSLIFSATVFVFSAIAYWVDLTGLICGVLAVMIFRQLEEGK